MKRLCSGALALLVALSAIAEDNKIRESLTSILMDRGIILELVEPSKYLPGLYRVEGLSNGLQPVELYVNEDASVLIHGLMYTVQKEGLVPVPNLIGAKIAGLRKHAISSVGQDDKITFEAKGEQKASISIFTDVECYYCRELHKEVPKLNAMGVQVNYLAFPRAFAGQDVEASSYKKLVSAWCSSDRLDAMNKLKLLQTIDRKDCENPVAAQYILGRQIGISATPAIILDDGSYISGYRPAEQLAELLDI